jgi:hypothetical protein
MSDLANIAKNLYKKYFLARILAWIVVFYIVLLSFGALFPLLYKYESTEHLALPDTEFVQKDLHHGCWALFTDDSCWNRDFYVSYDPVSKVRAAIQASLEHEGYNVVDVYGDGNLTFYHSGKPQKNIYFGDSNTLPKVHKPAQDSCLHNTKCTLIELDN